MATNGPNKINSARCNRWVLKLGLKVVLSHVYLEVWGVCTVYLRKVKLILCRHSFMCELGYAGPRVLG